MDKRIEEIKKRNKNRTQGVWRREYPRNIFAESVGKDIAVVNFRCDKDVDFIAHAPEDIDYLIAEIERLEKENRILLFGSCWRNH